MLLRQLTISLKNNNERLLAIEENEEDEDEASDLGNDCMFLESLRTELEKSISGEITV